MHSAQSFGANNLVTTTFFWDLGREADHQGQEIDIRNSISARESRLHNKKKEQWYDERSIRVVVRFRLGVFEPIAASQEIIVAAQPWF